MTRPFVCGTAIALLLFAPLAHPGELVNGRKSLVLPGQAARLVVDLAGGSLADFHLNSTTLNPLRWNTPAPGETSIHGFGHFLCLDRWGPPSAAEGARGMPYHGEAANVEWAVLRDVTTQEGVLEAQVTAELPKAGIAVRRTLRLSVADAVVMVREEITNTKALGRIYNVVQHPTIAPPFLDETTVVDCNGRRGFAQGGALPNPEEPSCFWPQAWNADGERVNLRRLAFDPNPNVVSYVIEDSYGWVTAASPNHGLLLGYVWKTSEYPWVSLWREVHDGKPAARGLEFGTTGLHQPFSMLVKKGRIWDRPLFEYLDAGESTTKSYAAFLMKIPADFAGVESVSVQHSRLILRERGGATREFSLETHGLIPDQDQMQPKIPSPHRAPNSL